MKSVYKGILYFLIFQVLLCPAFGKENKLITLKTNEIQISEALHLLAGYLQRSVILKDSVKGTTILDLTNITAENAFESLLMSNGLVKQSVGKIWVIGRQDEVIKSEQQEQKVRDLLELSLQTSVHAIPLHYAKAESIKAALSQAGQSVLSKRGKLYIDQRSNQVIIEESEQRLKAVEDLIKKLDVPVQQIMIDARIVSIDDDAERKLGIELSAGKSAEETVPYHLSFTRLARGAGLDVKLAALESAGKAELISSPSLFTINQQTASIEAGEEVPYQEVSEGGGTAVAFKKAVLGLKVTPQILPGQQILLQLQVNQDRPDRRLIVSMPTIMTRQISTNVLVKSGQTIVLGGIYENSKTSSQEAFPVLSRIPVLGWLFKQTRHQSSRRELLIFVKPTIIE